MRRSAPLGVLSLACALALTGCGGQDDPAPGDPSAGPDPAGPVPVALTVEVDDGPGPPATSRLVCRDGARAASGPLARRAPAERLCRHVRRNVELFTSAPPAGRICTEIYGGPQTAVVRGTIGGAAVSRRFHRRDGCAIAEWEQARPLLPPGGADAPNGRRPPV